MFKSVVAELHNTGVADISFKQERKLIAQWVYTHSEDQVMSCRL